VSNTESAVLRQHRGKFASGVTASCPTSSLPKLNDINGDHARQLQQPMDALEVEATFEVSAFSSLVR
jgi:hypothetical protein